MAVIDLFLYFILYSFLGWCCESVYCSVIQRKWVNRGFLNGPFCPVYGFGALLVLFLLRDVRHSFPALFLSGMVMTSVLEYITSVILEKLFHMHWWDYSHMRFNLNGRVCLLNSCEFGLLSVVVVMYIHPAVVRMTGRIPELGRVLLAVLLLLIIAADTIVTVRGPVDYERQAGRPDGADGGTPAENRRGKGRNSGSPLAERTDALKEDIDGRAEAWRELFTARMEIMEADYNEYKDQLNRRLAENTGEYRKTLEETRKKLDALGERDAAAG